ncbi:iron-sulfur cluster biosynthesis family protein [Ligilactobacillus cholophilus]|uniref:iron-sulfur cluster biosynthesis family protein n=1 Tax=Ligilactobacillus cholophilus TaxID=3050131 RepID=UPI0025AF4C46|nr:iron-sulfur cluster biosynthesis family protein [Ligilactobacillus cholophilus]
MELTITASAQDRLAKYFDDSNAVVLLDFDDGVGYRPEEAISCTLNQEFRLLIVNKDSDYHEYNAKIQTELGPMYYKAYSKTFMDEKMKIDVKPNGQLTMTGIYRGELTPALNVIDLRK